MGVLADSLDLNRLSAVAVMDKDDTLGVGAVLDQSVFPHLGGFCHVVGGKAGDVLPLQVKDLVGGGRSLAEVQAAEDGLGSLAGVFLCPGNNRSGTAGRIRIVGNRSGASVDDRSRTTVLDRGGASVGN